MLTWQILYDPIGIFFGLDEF